MRKNDLAIGVDLGGTKIRAALVERGDILQLRKEPTPLKGEAIIKSLRALIGKNLLSAKGKIQGIGLGVAGTVDFKRGVVVTSPNLPFKDVCLRDIIQEFFHLPTFLDNDANVGALAEKYYGVGRGVSNFVYITLGTGIGGGIIINGQIYQGSVGAAGEIGHMILDANGPLCTCGSYGCFEALASGPALARLAQEKVKSGLKDSLILRLAQGRIKDISPEVVTAAARAKDSLALQTFKEVGRAIGLALVNMVNIFNPEKIIFGGGLSEAGDLILNPAREVVKKQALIPNSQKVQIVLGKLKERAGVLGAASLALSQVTNNQLKITNDK